VTKIPKWISILDGIVVDVHISKTAQPDMLQVPWNSNVLVGEKIEWYDENYMRISDNVLIEQGIRFDNRGLYWYTNNWRKTVTIRNLDEIIPKGVTKDKPIDNEPNVWLNDKWEIDEMEKARLRNILSLEDVQSFVSGLVGDQL